MHANVAGVQRGDADVVRIADQFGTAHSPARLTAVAAQSAGQLYTSAAPALEFMFLNVRTAPFDDVRVRRALNYAVDRRAIVERSGGRAVAQPTCQILPPGFPGYVPSCPYTMNPSAAGSWTAPDIDKARRLIERSGTRGTRVTVWGHDDKRPILRYFASLLRRLGYDADARIFRDYFAYKSAIASPKTAQIGIEGFAADYAAPSNFAPSFVCVPPSYRPEKLSGFCDRRIAAKIDVARAARGAAADALWRRVYERIGRVAPAVPLVNRRTLTLVSRRVGNYQDHPLWGPLLDQLWVR